MLDRRRLRAMMLAALLAPHGLAAAEPLLEDPPSATSVEPTAPGEAKLTLGLGIERARSGRPRNTPDGSIAIETGIAPGLDMTLSQRLLRGQAGPRGAIGNESDWGGSTTLALRWQIAESEGLLPAFGLSGSIGTSYGQGYPTEEAVATALFSRNLRDGEQPTLALLNLGWASRLDPEPGERPLRYLLAAGVAQNLAQDTSLGLSYVREQQDRGDRDLNLVLAELSHRVSDGAILGVFAGAGIGRDSPRWQLGLTLKLLFGGG